MVFVNGRLTGNTIYKEGYELPTQNASIGSQMRGNGTSTCSYFKGLIDEVRIFNIALGDNNINGSGGNGNPAEPFPSSLSQYSVGQWSLLK